MEIWRKVGEPTLRSFKQSLICHDVHAIKNSRGQMRQISRGMEMITRRLVENGMTGFTNTNTARGFSDLYHVVAGKHCILCSALRRGCLT